MARISETAAATGLKTKRSRVRRLRALWYVARPDRTEVLGTIGIAAIVLAFVVLL